MFHENMKSSIDLNKAQEEQNIQNSQITQNTQITQNNQNTQNTQNAQTQIVQVKQSEASIKSPNEKTQMTFCELFHRLWDLDLIVMLVYAITFTLFPFATINQKVFSLNFNYSSNTLITV